MRIMAGKHKGRRIETGRKTSHIRPTSGFTREAIFNILTHAHFTETPGMPFEGKPVADICCGSGACGLEALSRGAPHVTFVDVDHSSLLNTRQNAERLGESENVSFVRANATQLPPARMTYGLVFLDPPYFSKLIPDCLDSLSKGGWINQDTLIVIEHDAKERPPLPTQFEEVDERRYGRTRIRLAKMRESAASAA